MRIMAVIMCHNSPDTTERIRRELIDVVDKMWVVDSGSDEGCRAAFSDEVIYCDNYYWTGCWNYAIELFEDSDCDVLWVIGGDIELRGNPLDYRKAIESAWPFGCWHPGVDGISRPLMQASETDGKAWSVWHLEGIAMAVSREAIHEFKELPTDNKLGWGLDIWMSWRCWTANQRNVLDGRVKVFHPDLRGYNSGEAHIEMLTWFDKHIGGEWRNELHYWHDDFDYNTIGEAGSHGVSVVMTSYNQLATLELALESFVRQDVLPIEVIISDDGSTDGTFEWLDGLSQDKYPFNVSYITCSHNGYNLAGAYNAGAAKARGERIIFTNADILHRSESVKGHMGLKLRMGSGYTGVIPLPISKAMTKDDITDDVLKERAKDDYEVDARIRGGNFSIPVDIFRELGGFNDSYAGKYGSEIADLMERAKMQGIPTVGYAKMSCGYHLAHPPGTYKKHQLGNMKFRNEYLGAEA